MTVVQNINPTHTSAVLGNSEVVLYGKGFIIDKLCDMDFAISSKAFYQVNSLQTEKLYALAAEFAELTGKETVIDAYCGIGTIGLSVSNKCKSVLGIEINRDSVRNANDNAKRNNVTNASFICGDAGAVMKDLARKTVAFHERIEITSKRTTREKLMTYLMGQAKLAGSDSFEIPFDRQELADFLEVDRSGLSAEIGKLRDEGVLESNRKHFRLL